jgi:pimeloyl-ACP methyl ester carboxylesterase
MPIDLYFDLPQHRAHVVDWGGAPNAPSVLLIHGLASNARIWNLVAPALTKQFRVCALDQRSHGLSSAPVDNQYDFAAMCGDIRLVGDRLGLDQPVLVGHSWGGGVALEYAARYRDRVRGIVMIDGGFAGLNKRLTWEDAEQRLAPPRLAGTPLSVFQERAKGWLGEIYSDAVFEVIVGNFEVRADGTVAPHLAFENHLKIVRAMWEQDADRLYAEVKCPALYLPCLPPASPDPMAEQFLTWKRESVAHIQALMPTAQIDWLSDSIHDVPLQRPQLVAEKIATFAKRVTAT